MLSGRLDDYAAMLEDPAIVKVLEEADEDPASAFEAAILAPLHQLREPAPTGRYLLIDALDEALARTKGQTIVDLLSSRINRLPPWLRIVATHAQLSSFLRSRSGTLTHEPHITGRSNSFWPGLSAPGIRTSKTLSPSRSRRISRRSSARPRRPRSNSTWPPYGCCSPGSLKKESWP
jgi:hypothetical protein